MDAFTFIYLAAGFTGLFLGGELLVNGASKLAEQLRISPLVIGLTVVAFGTSTPELAVSVGAAWKGNADIAIANVVGSNIFNILFILGICALIRPLAIHALVIRRELPIVILSSLLLFGASWGNQISKLEALILFSGIILYTAWLIREAKRSNRNDFDEQKQSVSVDSSGSKIRSLSKPIFFIVLGLGFVMIGADYLIEGAVQTAKAFGVSDAIIGLTIVAAGTSLPEVVASVAATWKGKTDLAVGNVIGSNIYNILCIIGLTGLVSPSTLRVSDQILSFDIPIMIIVSLFTLAFFWTGKKLSRTEGLLFLAAYVAYLSFIIWNQ